MPLPNIIKIFQTIKKLWHVKEFGLEIYSGEITGRRPKQKLSFLQAILLLDLKYVPAIYYQIISHIMGALQWPAQAFCFREHKLIMKIVRVVPPACDTPTSLYQGCLGEAKCCVPFVMQASN